jgi:hypothetical protein
MLKMWRNALVAVGVLGLAGLGIGCTDEVEEPVLYENELGEQEGLGGAGEEGVLENEEGLIENEEGVLENEEGLIENEEGVLEND